MYIYTCAYTWSLKDKHDRNYLAFFIRLRASHLDKTSSPQDTRKLLMKSLLVSQPPSQDGSVPSVKAGCRVARVSPQAGKYAHGAQLVSRNL